MPHWSVDILRKRAEHLGEVEPADEKAAIKKAAGEFHIPPERQNRISVRKWRQGQQMTPSNVRIKKKLAPDRAKRAGVGRPHAKTTGRRGIRVVALVAIARIAKKRRDSMFRGSYWQDIT